MIKDYITYVNEELTNPYTGEGDSLTFTYHYRDNYDGFKREFLDDLKAKLVGKQIYIDGVHQYNHRKHNKDMEILDNIYVNGKHVKPIYNIKVKDVEWSGEHRGDINYVNIIDDEGEKYRLKKVVDKKAYNKFASKAADELEKVEKEKIRKEKIRLKYINIDPYSEESWEDE
jgi:hypothetical protein